MRLQAASVFRCTSICRLAGALPQPFLVCHTRPAPQPRRCSLCACRSRAPHAAPRPKLRPPLIPYHVCPRPPLTLLVEGHNALGDGLADGVDLGHTAAALQAVKSHQTHDGLMRSKHGGGMQGSSQPRKASRAINNARLPQAGGRSQAQPRSRLFYDTPNHTTAQPCARYAWLHSSLKCPAWPAACNATIPDPP